MNPRDPETAVKYIDEVKAKYDGLLDRINKATSLVEISALEREGVRYVQELYLVTPRLQEALIITSQKNRRRLNTQIEPIGSKMEQVAEESSEPETEEAADVVVSEMEKTTEEIQADDASHAEAEVTKTEGEAEEGKEAPESAEPETENTETPAPELTVEKPVEKPAKKKTTRKKTTKKATK